MYESDPARANRRAGARRLWNLAKTGGSSDPLGFGSLRAALCAACGQSKMKSSGSLVRPFTSTT